MKMVKSLLLTSILATSIALPTNVFAEEPIKVIIDGQKLTFEVPPTIQEGTTLVPFRSVFERLGLNVTWNQETQSVVGVRVGLKIELKIGDKNVIVNGKSASLEVAPSIINGSTLVPLRFIGESANGEVYWNGEHREITIFTTLDTKLGHAVLADDVTKVKDLLKQGANPNYVDALKRTPLEWAIPSNIEVAKALLEGGADPNKKNELGNSPLHLAIMFGSPESVKLLVDAKADLNVTNSNGSTPLEFAKSSVNSVVDKYKPKAKEVLDIISKAQTKGSISFNGMKYEGDLVNGVPNGKGKFTMSNGTKYEGEVRDGKPDIQGKFTMSDGTYYEGQIANGVFEGQGTFVLADNSKYIGEFKNGKPNGIGAIYAPSGIIVQQGEYKDGNLIRSTSLSTGNANSPTSSGTITTKSELQTFLDQNFGELNTSMGTTKFSFTIFENSSILTAHDYWIMVKFDSSFFFDVKYSNKISSEMRTKVKQELKDHQERIGRAVVQAMPNKKFDGGYYDSWYKYPNLKIDLQTRKYYSWNNYDGSLIDGYENTKPSTFRWQSLIDDDF